MTQRRTFLVAFEGVLVASRMYVATFALLSCYERVFITKKKCIFHDFGIMDLRTTEPFRSDSRTFFSNLRTFGLKNLRTHEPSNLRTFGLIGCNRYEHMTTLRCKVMTQTALIRRTGVCFPPKEPRSQTITECSVEQYQTLKHNNTSVSGRPL